MNEWLIFVNEVLPEFGIILSPDKARELAKVMYENDQNISDMEYESHGGNSTTEIDYKKLYEIEKDKNSRLEHANKIYLNSICRRNHVSAAQVSLEDDSVFIYP